MKTCVLKTKKNDNRQKQLTVTTMLQKNQLMKVESSNPSRIYEQILPLKKTYNTLEEALQLFWPEVKKIRS